MQSQSDPKTMLRTGQRILATAGTNADLLGHALSQIHSALEHSFRQSLTQNMQVPAEIRARLSRAKDMDRIELIELMVQYGKLGSADAETIKGYNRIRNAIQHHNQVYRGTRQALDRYANLAEALITARDRSFAGAEISTELFEASRAMLGINPSPKERAIGNTPRSTPVVQASDPLAPTPQRHTSVRLPRSGGISANAELAKRSDRGNPPGTSYSTILMIVLIIVLVWLVSSAIVRDLSQPPQPTPTLSLPAGIIVRPLPHLVI